MSQLRLTFILKEYDGGECVVLTDKTSQIFTEKIKDTFACK